MSRTLSRSPEQERLRDDEGRYSAPEQTLAERFWRDVVQGEGCWIWQGTRVGKGYGDLVFRGKRYYAHRVSFELHFGAVPPGLFVCHHCDNPPCVRPDHLFAGTVRDNAIDMTRKGRHPGIGRPSVERLARGERQALAKLTDEAVVEIRQRYADGATGVELALEYDMTASALRQVVRGETWAHVGGPLTFRTKVRFGDGNGSSKLNSAAAIQIRAQHRDGATATSLAKQYGVSRQTISRLVENKTWKEAQP